MFPTEDCSGPGAQPVATDAELGAGLWPRGQESPGEQGHGAAGGVSAGGEAPPAGSWVPGLGQHLEVTAAPCL